MSLMVKQFVDEGLGNSSYLVASIATNLAAVIDPQRDIDRYVRAAEGGTVSAIKTGVTQSAPAHRRARSR